MLDFARPLLSTTFLCVRASPSLPLARRSWTQQTQGAMNPQPSLHKTSLILKPCQENLLKGQRLMSVVKRSRVFFSRNLLSGPKRADVFNALTLQKRKCHFAESSEEMSNRFEHVMMLFESAGVKCGFCVRQYRLHVQSLIGDRLLIPCLHKYLFIFSTFYVYFKSDRNLFLHDWSFGNSCRCPLSPQAGLFGHLNPREEV